jgi:hypothetical protein
MGDTMYAPTRTLARDERIVATPTADFDMEQAGTPTLRQRVRWVLRRRVGRTLSATVGWWLVGGLWDRVWARERSVERWGVDLDYDAFLSLKDGCLSVADAEEGLAWARESAERARVDGWGLADAEFGLECAEAELGDSLRLRELQLAVDEQQLAWDQRGARERVKDRLAVWAATAERWAY